MTNKKNRTILVAAVLAVFLFLQFFKGAAIVAAQEASETVTLRVDGVVIDGNLWVNLEKGEKWTYLFGFEDGARNTAIHYVPDEGTRDMIYQGLPTRLMEINSIDELVREIDRFYSVENNRTIPVNSALLVVRSRLTGVSEENIEKYLSYIRGKEKEN
jgi:hypothetical protein